MKEQWIDVIRLCEKLGQIAGVDLPDFFKDQPGPGQPAGRTFADVQLYNQTMLNHLAGFMNQVNRSLSAKTVTRKRSDG